MYLFLQLSLPLVSLAPSEFNSPRLSSGKMKGGEVNVWVSSVHFLHRHSHIYVTVGLPRQPPLTFWIYSDGAAHVEKTHRVFPVMHRGARH